MWGEFEDDNPKPIPTPPEDKLSAQVDTTEAVDDSLALKDRIAVHLAGLPVELKSQQRYEPDLTLDERKAIALQLLTHKPAQFLYRFGKYLKLEHLQHFLQYEGDQEIDHYVAETVKLLNQHTAKITVKNRRYVAMQRLRKSGDYFSEKEMERRNPLLFDQLVGKHLSDEEKQERNKVENSDMSFSNVLLEHIDTRNLKDQRKLLEEEEDDMFEEEDDDDEEEEEEETMDIQIEQGEKQLLKEEFYSASYMNFLKGKDEEFDYGQVDASDDYDLLKIKERDEEERYFDED